MRNSKEISAELSAKMTAMESAADAERATMASEIEALTRELQDAQIDEAARRALANQRTFSPSEEKELKRFSFSKFIRQTAEGNLDGLEAELSQEGEKEMRQCLGKSGEGSFLPAAFLRTYTYNNVTTATEGQEFAHVTGMSFAEALHNASVCGKLGARFLDGLQGNVAIVRGGAASAAWLAEEGAATDQKIAYSIATLKPKRVAATAGYTYDLLHQSSLEVDKLIADELVATIAAAIDGAALSGATNGPTGICGSTGINTFAAGTAASPTFAEFVKMETEVADDNALLGNLAYVVTPKTAGYLKTAAKMSGYPEYILQGGMINGYKAEVTKGVTATKAIFGNFNDLVIGGWAGLNLIVDPFSAKKSGVVEVTAMSYNDAIVRRPESFCVMTGLNIA